MGEGSGTRWARGVVASRDGVLHVLPGRVDDPAQPEQGFPDRVLVAQGLDDPLPDRAEQGHGRPVGPLPGRGQMDPVGAPIVGCGRRVRCPRASSRFT